MEVAVKVLILLLFSVFFRGFLENLWEGMKNSKRASVTMNVTC